MSETARLLGCLLENDHHDESLLFQGSVDYGPIVLPHQLTAINLFKIFFLKNFALILTEKREKNR